MLEYKVLGINRKNGKPFLLLAKSIISVEPLTDGRNGSRVIYEGGYFDVDKDNDWFKKFLCHDYDYSSCREI